MIQKPKSRFTILLTVIIVILLILVIGCHNIQRGKVSVQDLPDLIEDLEDEEPDVRLDALRKIEILGNDAKPALPRVLNLLSDKDEMPRIRGAAAFVVGLTHRHRALGVLGLWGQQCLLSSSMERNPCHILLSLWQMMTTIPVRSIYSEYWKT